MGELITGHGEDLPPFLKKGRKGKKQPDVDMSHAIAEGSLYLDNLFLRMELERTEGRAAEGEQRARSLQMRTGSLQNTLEESAAYNRLLLRGIRGLNLELSDAHEMLMEANGRLAGVPKKLSRAWDRGYIERAREEASKRIEARKKERENGFGRRASNLIRGRVASLMTTIYPALSSIGNRVKNIVI